MARQGTSEYVTKSNVRVDKTTLYFMVLDDYNIQ